MTPTKLIADTRECKDCSVMKIIARLAFNLGKGDREVAAALQCAITGELYIPGPLLDSTGYATTDSVDEIDRQCGHIDSSLEDKADRDDIIALVKRMEIIEEKVGIE